MCLKTLRNFLLKDWYQIGKLVSLLLRVKATGHKMGTTISGIIVVMFICLTAFCILTILALWVMLCKVDLSCATENSHQCVEEIEMIDMENGRNSS